MDDKKAKRIMEREKEHHLGLWCVEQARAFNKIVVKKYPKGVFRLLDDDFEVMMMILK